jgi:hypothetical protein
LQAIEPDNVVPEFLDWLDGSPSAIAISAEVSITI